MGTFYTFYWLGLSFGGHFPTFLKSPEMMKKYFTIFQPKHVAKVKREIF